MSEKEENEAFVCGLAIGVVITLALVIVIGGVASYQMSKKDITITSKVVSVVPSDRWYTITFANGESYKVQPYIPSGSGSSSIMDLDKAEHLIVKLQWSSGFMSPNDNDIWGIMSIVKW